MPSPGSHGKPVFWVSHSMQWSNREKESRLRISFSMCVCLHQPKSRATHLPWVEYVHHTLVSSATGRSSFTDCLRIPTAAVPVTGGAGGDPLSSTSLAVGPQNLEGDQSRPVTYCLSQTGDRRCRPAPCWAEGVALYPGHTSGQHVTQIGTTVTRSFEVEAIISEYFIECCFP